MSKDLAASSVRFALRMQRGGFPVTRAVSTAVDALDATDVANRTSLMSSADRLVALFDEPKPSKDLVLEALAAAYGYRDWNTLSGVLKKQASTVRGAAPEDRYDADLKAPDAARRYTVKRHVTEFPSARQVWFPDTNRVHVASDPIDHYPQVSRRRAPKVPSNAFHVVEIGDWIFHGVLSADGPYILCHSPSGWAHGCALIVSDLRWYNPAFDGQGEGWYLVKYDNQARMKLTGMDDGMILRLSHEFGFALKYHSSRDWSDEGHLFLASPAWHGLKEFVVKHPRLAKRYADCDTYFPRWHDLALEQNAVEAEAAAPEPRP